MLSIDVIVLLRSFVRSVVISRDTDAAAQSHALRDVICREIPFGDCDHKQLIDALPCPLHSTSQVAKICWLVSGSSLFSFGVLELSATVACDPANVENKNQVLIHFKQRDFQEVRVCTYVRATLLTQFVIFPAINSLLK